MDKLQNNTYCYKWWELKVDVEKIKLINDYLKKQLWMDFELCNMNCGKIELFGFLDEAGEDKIKIVFDSPYMMMSAFSFTYEGNSDFISLVTGDEAIELNKKYHVTQGNQIFKLSDTNVNNDMYIIAKGHDVEIMN